MQQWERKENHLFPADRICIPSDFSSASINVALFASGNTFQRLNYLGISKTVNDSSVGFTFDQDLSQIYRSKLITVRKYVSQGVICDDNDSEMGEEWCSGIGSGTCEYWLVHNLCLYNRFPCFLTSHTIYFLL